MLKAHKRLKKIEETIDNIREKEFLGRIIIIWDTDLSGVHAVMNGEEHLFTGKREAVEEFIQQYINGGATVIWINTLQEYAE